jgi:hypothetical protein
MIPLGLGEDGAKSLADLGDSIDSLVELTTLCLETSRRPRDIKLPAIAAFKPKTAPVWPSYLTVKTFLGGEKWRESRNDDT